MDRLVKTRAAYFGHIMRFAKFLHTVRPENIDLYGIQARHENFMSLRDKFDTVQDEIEILAADDKATEQQEERERFDEEYYNAEAYYRHIIKDMSNDHNETTDSRTQFNQKVKLPSINLPKFNGDITTYQSFKNIFNSLIDDNDQLSATQKFIYLRPALGGDALCLVSSLAVSDENYNIALELLGNRYSNVRSVIQAHLKNLFDLPVVKSKNVSILRGLIDHVNKNLTALRAMKEPVNHWDSVIVYLILSKLDSDSRELFEVGFKEPRMPTLKELLDFLSQRCVSFECISQENSNRDRGKSLKSLNAVVSGSSNMPCDRCTICKEKHRIYKCSAFLFWSTKTRFDFVKTDNLCLKCLGNNHKFKDCKFRPCYKCGKGHNYLLHFDTQSKKFDDDSLSPGQSADSHAVIKDSSSNMTALHSVDHSSRVLLYTAVVRIRTKNGRSVPIRGVIDPGSQVNVLSYRTVKALKLETRSVYANINGFGKSSKAINEYVELVAYANHSDYSFSFQAFVYPTITDDLPSSSFKMEAEFSNLNLADPNYNQSGGIDFLLSNAIYTRILKPGMIESSSSQLKAINTELGYIIGGLNSKNIDCSGVVSLSVTHDLPDLSKGIERFWLVEQIPDEATKTDVDLCEEHFERTVVRSASGKFSVRLPFSGLEFDFSFSRSFALTRLLSLERKFRAQPVFKKEYVKFMREYSELGHMNVIPQSLHYNKFAYYIPYHGIMNTNSTSTKLRVVFDGSSSPSNTTSLNAVLHSGPKLQNDIVAILIRFRFYRYSYIADIKKMFRMIEVHPQDRRYQMILWRENESDPIEEYELTTVTYGLKPSPYLAIRCLHKLADENRTRFPDAADIIHNDMFVDDIVSGFNSIEEGVRTLRDIIGILQSAGFLLHKWKSNSPDLISSFQNEYSKDTVCEMTDDSGRILGIGWRPRVDQLKISVTTNSAQGVTKRMILSKLAGIFDPLGWISPYVVRGKILMQEIWKLKINWDEELPLELLQTWNEFAIEMSNENSIDFKRFIGATFDENFDLIGFCDASQSAYGACIYVKSKTDCNLLIAKSKVAPIKVNGKLSKELSIARLELLAAVILSTLMSFVLKAFPVPPNSCHFFSDSKIVLAWLRKPASSWKLFVSNRIAEIQKNFGHSLWSYVPSCSNPADLISRGCSVKKLQSSDLWWRGPAVEISSTESFDTALEIRKHVAVTLSMSIEFLNKFSSYRTNVHVMVYVLRLISNCRLKKSERKTGAITVDVINNAVDRIIRIIQQNSFESVIERLKNSKVLRSKDSLISLNPFLDETGLLRVGGRLKNSNLPYSAKHPLILPKSENFVKLMIEFEHVNNEHCGIDTLITLLRQEFWIINARASVKSVVRKCLRCFRNNPVKSQQLMGELPSSRVTPAHPFQSVGIDYCGPFYVRPTRKRGNTTRKCYVALFICLGTKAVHLEIVFNLTTESFIATFRRFISRRSKPSEVSSDNGTYFVGANRQLKELSAFLGSESNQKAISSSFSIDLIDWHFIPARTPSFGGLWERAVRSMKNILHRVMGSVILSIEEFLTVSAQVEMCVNSRPLGVVSSSADNIDVLTPGHFLVGHHLKTFPQTKVDNTLPLGKR